MTDIDVHHLAAAYALDALDDRERSAFEAHYGACEVCGTDVVEFRQTLTHVADSLATPPPASLKASVMADISTTRQISPSSSSSASWRCAGAANPTRSLPTSRG